MIEIHVHPFFAKFESYGFSEGVVSHFGVVQATDAEHAARLMETLRFYSGRIVDPGTPAPTAAPEGATGSPSATESHDLTSGGTVTPVATTEPAAVIVEVRAVAAPAAKVAKAAPEVAARPRGRPPKSGRR